MSRVSGLFLGAGILLGVSTGYAWAIGPVGGEAWSAAPHRSLIIQVRQLTEKQKCKALNRCRQKYTRCYNKLVRDHKSIEEHKVDCVKPYQKCINASFSGFDFFFTRWFNPSYLDCSEY
ncbi:MAG: hypothetical protein ACE5FM_08020 [Methyloligellaceae bacterium]